MDVDFANIIEKRKHEIEKKKKKLEELKKRQSLKPNKYHHLKTNAENHLGVEQPSQTHSNPNVDSIMTALGVSSQEKFVEKIDEESMLEKLKISLIKNSLKSLSIVNCHTIDIPKKEIIYYSKNTQTMDTSNTNEDINNNSKVVLDILEQNPANITLNHPREKSLSIQSLENLYDPNLDEGDNQSSSDIFELNEEQIDNALKSKLFNEFFNNACSIIERAQGNQTDICFDYTREIVSNKEKKLYDLEHHRSLFNINSCKNKTISCLEWSLYYPELILASYIDSNVDYGHSNSSNQNPDGCVLVWNSRFAADQDKQEHTFHFQSPVTAACFSPFHPNIVLGGTYSGRILLWDNRTGKMMPAQRSNVSTACHAFPVFCTQIIGTANSHNLVSVSSDGRLCTWSLDMLTQPTETIDLAHKKARSISATSMSFVTGNVNNCMIGSEEGTIYNVQRLGNQTGIVNMIDAHFGPVTNVNCHPGDPSNPEFSKLYLSSSMDWTVKLMDSKLNRPLLTFEDYSNYICDVKWNPTKPSVFACVDSQGTLDIWDLNKSFDSPISSINCPNEIPLTKVCWSSNGNYIAVGGEGSRIEIYNTSRINQDPNSTTKQFVSIVESLKEKCLSNVTLKSNQLPNERLQTTLQDY